MKSNNWTYSKSIIGGNKTQTKQNSAEVAHITSTNKTFSPRKPTHVDQTIPTEI